MTSPAIGTMTWRDFCVAAWRQVRSGTRCRCGAVKIARRSFCYGCFISLPSCLRTALYDAPGYTKTYWRSLEFLGLLTAEEKALEREVRP